MATESTSELPLRLRVETAKCTFELMPRYYPNTRFSDCWSSAGAITYYHRNGKCFYRTKSSPIFPGTTGQLENKALHQRAIAAWRGIPEDDKEKWINFAKAVQPHRPPFERDIHISGFNLFLSSYHGFARLGNEHVPEPVAFDQLPGCSITYRDAMVISSTNLQLTLSVKITGSETPFRYKLLARIQLVKPGYGHNTGKMRSFLASEVQETQLSTRNVILLIPNFKTLYGLDLTKYTVHTRFVLLDSTTGYRNNYQKYSFECNLI